MATDLVAGVKLRISCFESAAFRGDLSRTEGWRFMAVGVARLHPFVLENARYYPLTRMRSERSSSFFSCADFSGAAVCREYAF